jgi:hypothetical protein
MPTRALPPGMHGEAIACFLEQDYAGPKELVVYNNDPALTLVYDHPEVKVINEPRNGRTLGQLFNATIAACRYDLLACWEDDDIRLPAHLSRMFAALGDADAVRPKHYWYLEKNVIKEWSGNGPAHSGWLLRRAALAAAGGYPADKSTDCVHLVWAALEKAATVRTWDCQPAETTFLYRWAGSSVHLSGFGVGDSVMDSADALSLYLQDRGLAVKGAYQIEPALSCDFSQLVTTYIKEKSL